MKLNKILGTATIALVLTGGGCFGLTKEQAARMNTSVAPAPTAPAVAPAPATSVDAYKPITIPEKDTMQYSAPTVLSAEMINNKQVRLQTTKGEIVFDLYADTAPLTVSNFVNLANGGYYNGLTFHRREEGFVIQGGDPRGNGTGGPGYKFADELKDSRTYVRGTVAMANSGPNTNGSQFFIMLDDVPLPHLYTIFGQVTEGIDIVDQIKVGDAMTTVTVEDKK
jgi:cyclophilin family peptidyl-prolyl cis-trans isomerase